MRPLILLLSIATLLTGQQKADQPDWQQWLTQGVDAYKAGNYPQALELLQKSIDQKPDDIQAHSFLASTCLALYVPGDASARNLDLAKRAEASFTRVVSSFPENKSAVLSLASLNYQEAQGTRDLNQALQYLDHAGFWYERLAKIDPDEKQAYQSLGAIAWSKWYPQWLGTRGQAGLKFSDPGPLPDATVRRQLRDQYDAILERGIWNLEKALQIDPKYTDAMDYMNLLIRERADLKDTKEEYDHEIQVADQWLRKAHENPNGQVSLMTAAVRSVPATGVHQLIPIPALTPVRKVDPAYPQLARDSGVEGTVRLRALIGKDGRVQTLQLMSGNLLLASPAREAVQRWVFPPTALEGVPVEVLTDISVRFGLPAAAVSP